MRYRILLIGCDRTDLESNHPRSNNRSTSAIASSTVIYSVVIQVNYNIPTINLIFSQKFT
ncbi:hypothetical protein [Nostoc sp. TCL240-02]|uniref:hypothetical protein n=1 Tax=Nostoc sp. TCL240-02 TaxID=2572090 RepID=UPI00157F8751|nr:hypothetical protein [Nostoc sp. TCL240-02]QKQ75419.1 hypothetical protein FBB35_20845 [Nostoc sp. TCL240-02]